MKTITLTEEEFQVLEEFILTDAEDMREMSDTIEGEASERMDDDSEEERPEFTYDETSYKEVKGDGYEADAYRAQLLKKELKKRFKNSQWYNEIVASQIGVRKQ